MPDEELDPTVEMKPPKTKEELKETLEGILGWVQKKKETAKVVGKASPWGWVFGLIAAVLVFLALAFAAWQAWKKGREIAKLKHKIDVDEEAKRQAEVDAKMMLTKTEKRKLEARASDLQGKINDTKAEIVRLEEERRADLEKIDAVTTWEDVDKLLRK